MAVLVDDEFEEEEVKDDDEKGDGDPEHHGQPAVVVTVPMESDHVMLVSRSCKIA